MVYATKNSKELIVVTNIWHINNIISKINGSVNEDIFFSTLNNMKYCKDMKIHRQFLVEEIFSPNPIGFHKVYNNHQIQHKQWNHIINYIKQQLL